MFRRGSYLTWIRRRAWTQEPTSCIPIVENGRVCEHCVLPHSLQIHTTSSLFKANKMLMKLREADKKKVPKREQPAVNIWPDMRVSELALGLKIDIDDVMTGLNEESKKLKKKVEYTELEEMVTNIKVLKEVCEYFDRRFKVTVPPVKKDKPKVIETVVETETKADVERQGPPDPSVLVSRPPIITIMGHVDHGKTTLLDALRESNVVDQEFGGITQHIGAFSVKLESGETITFLDTPGHAAFSSMRERGASVTDVVILVVAAGDGLMPQTKESIKYAKKAKVPVVVAINKIDAFSDSEVEEIKYELAEYGLVCEDHGGDVQVIPISALKKINLAALQQCVVAEAEMLNLKGDPVGLVEGRVIESNKASNRGRAATVIIQRGTLRQGDVLIAGTATVKVRAMYDEHDVLVKEAPPSTAVLVNGWRDTPEAGDEVLQVKSERELNRVLSYRISQKKLDKMHADESRISLLRFKERQTYKRVHEEKVEVVQKSDLSERKQASVIRRLNQTAFLTQVRDSVIKENVSTRTKFSYPIIIKGDVHGSLEAISNVLGTFYSSICTVDIMKQDTGDVSESDIQLAQTFGGSVYAFNVNISPSVADIKHKVPIKHHNVIYELFDDMIESINEALPIKTEEKIIGKATVQEVFDVTMNKKKVCVAGCKCTSGELKKKMMFKLLRKDDVIYKGPIHSLKHLKKEVESIKMNTECGVNLGADVVIQDGDEIICYSENDVHQTIEWSPPYLDT